MRLATLDKKEEFKLHVKGTLRNGCSIGDKRGVTTSHSLCGVPVGIAVFKTAQEAINGYEQFCK